jgi:hypothetical protein
MIDKICLVCRTTKPLDKFVKHKICIDGRGNMCKDCYNQKKRDQRFDNRAVSKEDKQTVHDILTRLGYNLNSDIPVYQQFLIKHNLVK